MISIDFYFPIANLFVNVTILRQKILCNNNEELKNLVLLLWVDYIWRLINRVDPYSFSWDKWGRKKADSSMSSTFLVSIKLVIKSQGSYKNYESSQIKVKSLSF